MVTPLFVCTGFLDSGKTTLVKDTLMEQDWIEEGLTLLIVCEEGEEEYFQMDDTGSLADFADEFDDEYDEDNEDYDDSDSVKELDY